MEESVDDSNRGVKSTFPSKMKGTGDNDSHCQGLSSALDKVKTEDNKVLSSHTEQQKKDTHSSTSTAGTEEDTQKASGPREAKEVTTEENIKLSTNIEPKDDGQTSRSTGTLLPNNENKEEDEMTQKIGDTHSDEHQHGDGPQSGPENKKEDDTKQHRKGPQSDSKPNINMESERDNEQKRTEVKTEDNKVLSSHTEQQKKDTHSSTSTAGTEEDTQKASGPREGKEVTAEENIKLSTNIEPKDDGQTSRSTGTLLPNNENKEEDEPLQQLASSEPPQKTQTQSSVSANNKTWIAVLVVVCAVFAYQCFSDSTQPVQKEFNVVDVFNEKMDKVRSVFPNQRLELWRRSRIHLSRHLKTASPTEPVSLILTSGRGAERTLGCLAQRLAGAFSAALNSSVLYINAKSKASQDSDQVKLDIDSELKEAFGGEKLAAVIHRIEELPPGSTLIFYRYCDHENAAYKKVFLVFTVILDAEVEIPPNVSLGRVEDMVHEQLKQKFVSSDKSAVFNQMDVDKLSGLWSRISHLILPVVAEDDIEQLGCGSEGKSF